MTINRRQLLLSASGTLAAAMLPVVGAASAADGDRALGSLIARKRVVGRTGSANASNLTGLQVIRAPAAFDAVRLILHVNQANLPGSAVKMTIAPQAGPGYQPVDAKGAPVRPIPVTWNGQPALRVANAAKSADGGMVENDYVSDRIGLASLDRADGDGLPPLVQARIQASSFVPMAAHYVGGPSPATEPDYVGGLYSGDRTMAVLDRAPGGAEFHIPVTWVFYLKDRPVVTIGAAGDSTMQGSHSSPGTAVDGTDNLFNGFHRQLADLLDANGFAASVEQMCFHGEPSLNFHEKARNALSNLGGAGLTHLMVFPVSVNDPAPSAQTFQAAQARVRALIDLAVAAGVTPILVRNPPGYETPVGSTNGYNAFLDAVAAQGRAIVWDVRPPMGLAAAGYPAMPDAGRLHDEAGALLQDKHPNDHFHAIQAAAMYAGRVDLRLTRA